MYTDFTGRYQVHESSRSFADVVAALEAAVGSVENDVFAHEVSEARDPSDFEERMHRHESTSGFMRFHTIDHGAWLQDLGYSAKARMYTIGNPLIARTMIKYDLGVGLNDFELLGHRRLIGLVEGEIHGVLASRPHQEARLEAPVPFAAAGDLGRQFVIGAQVGDAFAAARLPNQAKVLALM